MTVRLELYSVVCIQKIQKILICCARRAHVGFLSKAEPNIIMDPTSKHDQLKHRVVEICLSYALIPLC